MTVVRAQIESWNRLVADLNTADVGRCIALAEASFLPAVAVLLRLYATLPVSNATAERSFSKLKLLKTYLRTTMSQDRLTGLALMYMYVHRLIDIDIDKVIDAYQRMKDRRILL